MEDYYTWLILNGRRPSFAKKQVQSIERIIRHCQGDLTTPNLQQYFVQLLTNNGKPSNINVVLNRARVYVNYCVEKGLPCDRSILSIKQMKVKAGTVRGTLTDTEIEAFLAVPVRPGGDESRHDLYTLMFALIAFSGARPREISSLTPPQLDFQNGMMEIDGESNKTGLGRRIPIPPNILPAVRIYVNAMGPRQRYLFPSIKSTKYPFITDSSWIEQVQYRLKVIGVNRPNITCYSLRHSYCSNLANNDTNIFKLKALMGHRKTETTEVYFHNPSDEVLIKTVREKHSLINKQIDKGARLEQLSDYVKSMFKDEVGIQHELLKKIMDLSTL
jgi:integrase